MPSATSRSTSASHRALCSLAAIVIEVSTTAEPTLDRRVTALGARLSGYAPTSGGCRVKLLLALMVGTFSVVGVAHAASPFYRYDEGLSRVARNTLWRSALDGAALRHGEVRSVGVRCYRDKETFEQVFEARSGTPAARVVAYYAGGRDVHLRSTTCANIDLFLKGQTTVRTAGAYAVLLHETLHRQGVRDERMATCFANASVRRGVEWLGGSEARALRARNLAFTYTRLYAPPSYRMGAPDCLALARRSAWPDFV